MTECTPSSKKYTILLFLLALTVGAYFRHRQSQYEILPCPLWRTSSGESTVERWPQIESLPSDLLDNLESSIRPIDLAIVKGSKLHQTMQWWQRDYQKRYQRAILAIETLFVSNESASQLHHACFITCNSFLTVCIFPS